MDFEKSTGWLIIIKAMKQTSHLGLSRDVCNRFTNPGEQGAFFIPTRVLVTRGQTQQDDLFCESLAHNCTAPEDCDIGNERVQKKECASGHCMHRQWCPAEDPSAPTTEVHYPEYEQAQLWFISYLHFHRFQLDVSTCDETEPIHYPHRRANTYRLWDLVRMTGAEFEVGMGNGMVMIVNALFQCELNKKDCDLKVEAATVDKNFYCHIYNHFHFEDGVRRRDSYRMFGVRLVAFSTGFGHKTSVAQIVRQISSAISLLSFAEIIAGFRLTYVIAERNHYYKLEHNLNYLHGDMAAALTLTHYCSNRDLWEPLERDLNYLHRGTTAVLTLTHYCFNRDLWEPLEHNRHGLHRGTTAALTLAHLGTTAALTLTHYCFSRDPWEPIERNLSYLHCASSARGLLPQGARGLQAWGALLAGTTYWRPGSERWKPSCISGAPGRQTSCGLGESCCRGTAWPSTRRTRTSRAARRTTRVWPPCVCAGTLGRRSTASPRECTSARPDSDTTSRSGSPCCAGGRSAAIVRRT